MQVADSDRILHSCKWSFVRRLAVKEPTFRPAAEQEHAAGSGKVPVHPEELQVVDNVRLLNLVRNWSIGLTCHKHAAAELTGKHDKRTVEQATFFEIQDQPGDRSIDHLL